MAGRSLHLRANLAALEPLVDYCSELARVAELGRPDSYRLRLAVDELVTNIVIYGYGEDACGVIDLDADVGKGRVRVLITDRSAPFDPTAVVAPASAGTPSDPSNRIGGNGLLLVRQVTDALRYERVEGENRTRVLINRRPDRRGDGGLW